MTTTKAAPAFLDEGGHNACNNQLASLNDEQWDKLRGDPYHPSTHGPVNEADDCPVNAAELFELGDDSDRGEIEEATLDPLPVDASPTTWKLKIPRKRRLGLGRTIYKRRRKSTEELSYPNAVTPLPPTPRLPKPKVLGMVHA